jgi:hypothetical protein
MRHSGRGRWGRGLAVCLLLTAAGCSPPPPNLVPVHGKLLWGDGRPIANASLQFLPAEVKDNKRCPVASAMSGDDGSFDVQTYLNDLRASRPGAVPGRYKVQVLLYPGGPQVPSVYTDPERTPLLAQVPAEGTDNLTLHVEPP